LEITKEVGLLFPPPVHQRSKPLISELRNMKKVILIISAFALLCIARIIYLTGLNQGKNQIVDTYRSDTYGYSFQVPNSFSITKTDCDNKFNGVCLEKFLITPKLFTEADIKYLSVATITLVKGIEDIQFSGQLSRSIYNTKTDTWVDETSMDQGPVSKDMLVINMDNNVISRTSVVGSQRVTSIDLITDKNKDLTFVLSKPVVERIRCDLLDITKKQICINYLHQIKAEVEGWTPVSLYADFFKETDTILRTFQWRSNTSTTSTETPDISQTPYVAENLKTFTNDTYYIPLTPQNSGEGNGVSIATLTDLGNEKTKIVIQLDFMAGKPPANIYKGSCLAIGLVAYPLTEVINGLKTNSAPGKSETILNISLQNLRLGRPLAIGIRHLPLSDSLFLAWCGDLN